MTIRAVPALNSTDWYAYIQELDATVRELEANGDSAYSIAVAQGFSGSVLEWLDTLRGPSGPPGDQTPVSISGISGTVSLAGTPNTQILTATGNVTFTIPTPTADRAFTVSLVFIQDATGSRTVTWPASIRWSEGVKGAPSPLSNSITLFHFFWTGTYWLGMKGGQNFA